MAGTVRTLRDRPDRQTLRRLDAGSLVREARLIAVDRAELRRLIALTPAERLREFELRIAAHEASKNS